MEVWDIEYVTPVHTERGLVYQVVLIEESGARRIHSTPRVSIEHRAVEYGYDPVIDLDEVMDILLHEIYIPPPDLPANFENDEAGRRGKMSPATRAWGESVKLGDLVPTWLGNSASAEEAREAHLIRVEAVKSKRVRVNKPSSNVFQPIRETLQPDPERLRMIEQSLSQYREGNRVKLANRRAQTSFSTGMNPRLTNTRNPEAG